jgi:hypothetical protein
MTARPQDFRRALIIGGPDGRPLASDSAAAFRALTDLVSTVEMWYTPTAADLGEPVDQTPAGASFPHPGETAFRVLEFRGAGKRDVAAEKDVLEKIKRGGGPGAVTRGSLHRTKTTDYFVVVSGVITLSAVEDDVSLQAGDTAICLGAMHGWTCQGPSPARVFTVQIGAENYGDAGSLPFPASSGHGTAPEGSGLRRVALGHDSAGVARILRDDRTAVPETVWSTASVADNTVRSDRLGTPQADGSQSADGTRFVADNIPPGASLSVPGRNHQVLGILIAGGLRIRAGEAGVGLDTSDTFVVAGSDFTLENSGTEPSRVAYVS